MKAGVAESERAKLESRHSFNRRKMPKNSHILNGADGNLEDESIVRQVNLAAAFHDHISCTKSPELCKIPDTKENRANLPCETDHIYANCGEKSKSHNMVTLSPSKDRNEGKKQLHDMCLIHLDLIKHLEEQITTKDKQIRSLKHENEVLKINQSHIERSMCLYRKSIHTDNDSKNLPDASNSASDSPTPSSSPAAPPQPPSGYISPSKLYTGPLVTRYMGRNSKTIPLRALKRRYLRPPKTLTCKKPALNITSSTSPVLTTNAKHEDEEKCVKIETEITSPLPPKPPSECSMGSVKIQKKKHGKKHKFIPRLEDFLVTDKEYYLPDSCFTDFFDNTDTIDVPSWRLQPVPSFYQMEGTENIDDRVFQRRHQRCEQDEKRRKRWDMQRLREQRAFHKLNKRGGCTTNDEASHKRVNSLYPNSKNIEYIEVADKLPVLAFGRPIPLFQPCEFSLPWKVEDIRDSDKVNYADISSVIRVTT